MNVNTYDATPMHEEVISGSQGPSPRFRTYEDQDGDFWFEVEPDRFVYTGHQTRRDAEAIGNFGVREDVLRERYPNGRFV